MTSTKSDSARRILASPALAAPVCAALLLAACGGGGGDDGGSPAPAQGSLVVTSANAQAVAADALDAATNMESAQAGSSFVTGSASGAAAARASMRLLKSALPLATGAPSMLALPRAQDVSGTVPCSGGGSLTVSGSIASEAGLSTGDRLNLSANECKELVDGVMTTMSGAVAISVVSGSYTMSSAYPRRVGLSIMVSNFAVADAARVNSGNGDLVMDLTENSATGGEMRMHGNSMRNTVTTATGTRSATLRDYQQRMVVDAGVETYTMSGFVESSSPRLGSVSYRVSTPAALVSAVTGAYTGGSLQVQGNRSSLVLTVTAPDTFRIDADTTGDDVFDWNGASTLGALRGLL